MFLSKDVNNNNVYKELNFKDYLSVNLFKKVDNSTNEDYLTLLQIVSYLYGKNRDYDVILQKVAEIENDSKLDLYNKLKNLENSIKEYYYDFYKDLEEFAKKFLDNKQILENLDITLNDFLKGGNDYIWRITNSRFCFLKSK